MKDKKNIDRLFQEKFKDFEITPNDAVWSNIEAELNKKKKRRVIPIWWRYAGVAALLLLLLTVGNSFFNPSNSNSNNIDPVNNVVNIETEKIQPILDNNSIKNPISTSSNTVISNNTPVITDNHLKETESNKNHLEKKSPINKVKSNFSNNLKETSVAANTSAKNHSETQKKKSIIANESKVLNSVNSPLKENAIANTILNKTHANNSNLTQDAINKSTEIIKIDETIKDSSNAIASIKTEEIKKVEIEDEDELKNKTETIEEAIAKNKEDIVEEEYLNRWSVAPNAAPVYFNTLGEGSSIASQFNNNSKTGEVNMSYGINASYAINKKLIVRSGINRVNLGYNTNNVAVFESANATAINALASIKGSGSSDVANSNIETDVSLISGENVNANKITPEAFSTASSANINQSLGFIEIPIEFQYIVSDKKMGVNVIGGFSSFFLNNNELFSETNNSRTLIGEAVNVNKVSYSANFGLGLNYKMTKKINLNFEPMFKYQINTFNNTSGDFKPYFIGIYTGIGFKF